MRTTFSFTDFRQNPHSFWFGDEHKSLTYSEKVQIAENIADLEVDVWSAIDPNVIEGPHGPLAALNSRAGAVIGVSYKDPEDLFSGPYTSYYVSFEIDPRSPEWSRLYTSETGRPIEDFITQLPFSHSKVYYISDQSRADTPEAKREHAALMDDIYRRMEAEGAGFVSYSRGSTTRRLRRQGELGRVVISAERRIPDFYGPGDDTYMTMGYYVPAGVNRPGLIESTRRRPNPLLF